MLRDDLLKGAQAIADHLGFDRREVYYMAEQKTLPITKKGRLLYARRSELDASFSSTRTQEG